MAKLLAFKGTKAKGNLFEIAVTGSADELARELDRDKGSECRKIFPHVTVLPPCIDKLEGTFSLVSLGTVLPQFAHSKDPHSKDPHSKDAQYNVNFIRKIAISKNSDAYF